MNEHKQKVPVQWLIGGTIGAIAAVATTFLVLIPGTLFILRNQFGIEKDKFIIAICVCCGGLFGGVISHKKGKGGVIMSGTITAILSFIILCMIGLIGWQSFGFRETGLIGGCLAAGSLLGSLLSSKRQPTKKGKRRTLHRHIGHR